MAGAAEARTGDPEVADGAEVDVVVGVHRRTGQDACEPRRIPCSAAVSLAFNCIVYLPTSRHLLTTDAQRQKHLVPAIPPHQSGSNSCARGEQLPCSSCVQLRMVTRAEAWGQSPRTDEGGPRAHGGQLPPLEQVLHDRHDQRDGAARHDDRVHRHVLRRPRNGQLAGRARQMRRHGLTAGCTVFGVHGTAPQATARLHGQRDARGKQRHNVCHGQTAFPGRALDAATWAALRAAV